MSRPSRAAHTVGVCGVVRDPRGYVLLVRTAKAGWELPGGRVEASEDLHAALRRETREEASCELTSIGRLTGVYFCVASQSMLLVFAATSDTPSPAPECDEDALEAGWFVPDEALRKVSHQGEHQRLLDGLTDGAGVVYRSTAASPIQEQTSTE